ncbi:SDR family NAD(P)-dependent oxidoreductase [Limibaculum sp. M0105]|uniref:SDR family NAD(P)-dependent oxidoreductase n=1 Tax=Thermohalobaculum xanthum TaxID=2753746 RepID=A0A8J7M910_9RHOB|nr:SDR family NAD(P)-dependent oxidoreductase [Thermohalobaculum xanthum]MBK0400450.1 SDR family NAD(P)-dependent oxidoreductase [Thermohalobaculum xanthum]
MRDTYGHALIMGAGTGLSASLARAFAGRGMRVSLAARGVDKLGALAAETGARAHGCDAADAGSVAALFEALDREGAPDVVVYNPSARVRGPLATLDPAAVAHAVGVTALGAFYVAREAAIRMEREGRGAILFTGASAGVKGYAQSAPFAMGKFALRGLAQSMARELHPKGIHVGHFVIDGGIRNPGRAEPADAPDSMLDPDAIAASYCDFLDQDRSCWAWEIELRPWVERF